MAAKRVAENRVLKLKKDFENLKAAHAQTLHVHDTEVVMFKGTDMMARKRTEDTECKLNSVIACLQILHGGQLRLQGSVSRVQSKISVLAAGLIKKRKN